MKKIQIQYYSRKFADSSVLPVRSKKGFTLVELMVAASIFSIVLFSAGTMIVAESRNAIHNRRIVDMQRDASLTINTIGNRIRRAYVDTGEVSQTGHNTIYFESSKASYAEWKTAEGRLVLMPENIDLIDTQWEIRNFYVEQNTIDNSWYVVLQLRLPGTTSEIILPANFMPRNTIPGV